jgi:hypothetical protein
VGVSRFCPFLVIEQSQDPFNMDMLQRGVDLEDSHKDTSITGHDFTVHSTFVVSDEG